MNMHKNAWLTPRGRERIVRQVDGSEPIFLDDAPRHILMEDRHNCRGMFGSIASVFTVMAAPPLGRRRSVSQKR
jgi:hypothetical protein